MTANDLFLESHRTAQNSAYVGAVFKVSAMSHSSCGRSGTLANASYTCRLWELIDTLYATLKVVYSP